MTALWVHWLACSSETGLNGSPAVDPIPHDPTTPTIPPTTPVTTDPPTDPIPLPESPVCTIFSPTDGLLTRPGVDFVGTVVDADTAPTGLSASWETDVGGPVWSGPVAVDGHVDVVGQLSDGGHYVVSLTGADEGGRFCESSVSVDVDLPPSMPELSILPFDPTTEDELVLSVDVAATDPEGLPLTTEIVWLVNDVPSVLGSVASLPASESKRGDVVVVGMTASDALGAGPTGWSDPVVIANTPPGPPVLAIVPGDPVAGDAMTCVVTVPSTDADADPVTYTMGWTVDTTPFFGATEASWPGDSVAGGTTSANEVWTCVATPFDGFDVGTPAEVPVTILPAVGPNDCPDGNCALRFDGIDDWVQVANDTDLAINGRPWTVEAWVWFDDFDTCAAIVRKGTASSPTYEYWLHKNISPSDSGHWLSATGFSVLAFGAFDIGRWHHFAGTWQPATSTATVFVDGMSLGSTIAFGTPTPNTNALLIGIDWDFGCEMDGVIDEVRISDVVRYAGPFAPDVVHALDANTVALWHFDEYVGGTAFDATGAGHDGAVNGAIWTDENPP